MMQKLKYLFYFIFVFFISTNFVFADSVYQSYTSPIGSSTGSDSSYQFGQSFKTTDGYNITGVHLKVYRVGTLVAGTVGIRATSSCVPTGSDLVSKAHDFSGITTSTSGEDVYITFDSSYELAPNTCYAITITGISSGTLVSKADDNNGTADTFYSYLHTGTWSSGSPVINYFETLGTALESPPTEIVVANVSNDLSLTLEIIFLIILIIALYFFFPWITEVLVKRIPKNPFDFR